MTSCSKTIIPVLISLFLLRFYISSDDCDLMRPSYETALPVIYKGKTKPLFCWAKKFRNANERSQTCVRLDLFEHKKLKI